MKLPGEDIVVADIAEDIAEEQHCYIQVAQSIAEEQRYYIQVVEDKVVFDHKALVIA